MGQTGIVTATSPRALTLLVILEQTIMKLSPQDFHVFRLWENYKSHDLKESLREYHFLIDTLIYVHEVISEQSIQIKHCRNYQKPCFISSSFMDYQSIIYCRELLYNRNIIAMKFPERPYWTFHQRKRYCVHKWRLS